MDEPLPRSPTSQEGDRRLAGALEDLSRMKDEVVKTKVWYEEHAKRSMVKFRVFGVAIIILSVSLPLLGVLSEDSAWKNVALSGVALAIAGLTGLNSFFQWQAQWQGFRQTQFALEYLLSRWELEMFKAKYLPDEEEALRSAMEATARLLDLARDATASETAGFFEGVRTPEAK